HPAVVQAHMINKWQKNKMPLKNFTMNMYDDQITTILGLSDSGKSAAANSISGSSPGNSGWVKVDDYDIIKRHSSARSSLGLSPQHSPLFGSLTVKEHLDFFSSLRGGPKRRVSKKRSTQKYLKALELDNVASVKARNLSDSDRKRLSVACAFCGDPRIIILDEPTEGLEPSERRLMWDFLQSEKRCRTIIVTTYHIEEADFLADRVAILCDGQIIFNGTSVFLRNSYGSGYQLVCSQGQISVEPIITNMVLKHIPDTSSSCDRPCEVSYNIPQTSCRSIVPLLRELEGSEHSYNMEAIQIGTTPIIEKFVNATTPACNGFIECFESGAFYLLFLVLSIFSGFFAASIIRERVIGFKLLQQVEGLNMATFWLSHLLWDWIWLSILSILLLIIMYLIMDKEFNDET
ncbi:hypothetical protein KR067_013642, partial [Drosophila pandora]